LIIIVNDNPHTNIINLEDILHDLSTPISSIYAAAQLMLLDVDEFSQDTKENINIITNNCKYIINLLNQFRALKNANTDNIIPVFQNIDISDETDKIVNSIKLLASEKSIKIKYIKNIQNYNIVTDISFFTRIITNLVSNAIKFCNKNDTITIKLDKYYNNIKVTVSDTGTGINENYIDSIFNRYFKYDSDENKNGCGIGLNITYRLVKLLSGKISAYNNKNGKGSTFIVIFPNNNTYKEKIKNIYCQLPSL